jgi:hypothetical protein
MLALAGCIGGKDNGGQQLTTTSSKNQSVFTAPPDGRNGSISAFSETNQTVMGGDGAAHPHDYWQGKTRITLFDLDAMMAPNTGGQNPSTSTFSVPKGTLVYEGTNSIEFTISDPKRHVCEGRVTFGNHFICTDDTSTAPVQSPQDVNAPDPTGGGNGFTLRYRHAATSTWIDAGSLSWGQAKVIKITDPKQTDMPHSTSSLWQFEVVSPNGYDNTLEFHAKADLVRDPSVPIPLWPGHPLFYSADKHVRDVFEGDQKTTNGYVSAVTANTPAGVTTGIVIPKRLISYGTTSVYVWANITSADTPNPATAPDAWFLYHTNASGRDNLTNGGDAKASSDGKHFFWVLPVTPDDMDSPYQDTSRWQFALEGSVANCINCADYTVSYHLTVKSSDIVEKEYYLYCYDPADCKGTSGG